MSKVVSETVSFLKENKKPLFWAGVVMAAGAYAVAALRDSRNEEVEREHFETPEHSASNTDELLKKGFGELVASVSLEPSVAEEN